MMFSMEDSSMEEGSSAMETDGSLFCRLSGSSKLERDRALTELKKELLQEPSFIEGFMAELRPKFEASTFGSWEEKCGILNATTEVLRIKSYDVGPDLSVKICNFCCKCLSDDEVRVRSGAGSALGALIGRYPHLYSGKVESFLLESIKQDLQRSTNDESPSEGTILHDTAGWRHLETSIQCLRCIVEEIGAAKFSQTEAFVNNEFIELILMSTKHTNRFVRETAFFTIGSMVEAVTPSDEAFALTLAQGMADNWSQVRMSAVVATRGFFISKSSGFEEFYGLLLPRLCLNRYYLAEGVRIYSQETWKMIVGDKGKALVEKYLCPIVDYYAQCANADNHAVREAACHCISEMVKKIDRQVLEPYVERLLETLSKCFKDESWPVRDTACVACGAFILQFPGSCRKFFEDCKPLFLENLKDPIISVRHGGAIALANTVRAYGKEEVLHNFLRQEVILALKDIVNQPSETLKYEDGGSSGLSQFGVTEKKIRDNDFGLHENQVMYSCGSLAPKMSRGGCSDGGRFRKPSEPWERADGCLHLLAELSSICPEDVVPLLPDLAEASRHRHYANHFVFVESIVRRLPEIARNITKKHFKPLLENFMEPIFYGLNSENLLASSAAEACIQELSGFLGANIFRGRVEQFNPSYLDSLDRISLSTPPATRPAGLSFRSNEKGMSDIHLGGTPT